jgi:hypothetical protein
MKISLHVILLLAAVGGIVTANVSANTPGPRPNAPLVSWNVGNQHAPLLRFAGPLPGNFSDWLAYPGSDFALPLFLPLYHDSECDCFALTLQENSNKTSRVVQLWRTPGGFYRSGSGPYVELQDLAGLKELIDLHGTRYLFAQVNSGEWHCVSIHDAQGNYLLIDYGADGLISRLRDSRFREVIPTYAGGRMIQLKQVWMIGLRQRVQRITL